LRRVVWTVIVVALAATVATRADAQTRIATYGIRGENHRFAVPSGWTTQPGKDLVTFAAPADKVKGAFQCVVMGASMPAGVSSTGDLVKLLADDEIKNRKPWAHVVQQKQTPFVGVSGDLIALAGVGPDKKERVTVLVAAKAKTRLYVFAAEGRKDDFQTVVKDLDEILSGVEPLGTAPETFGSGPKGSFGQGQVAAGEREQGVATGLDAALADPLWGIALKGLDSSWRMKIDASGYLLLRSNPAAMVRLERLALDNAKLKKSKEVKGARPGTFAGKEALIVDGKDERTIYVLRGDHALVVRARGPEDAAGQIERGILFGEPTYRPGQPKKGGAALGLPFGVEVWPLPSPWRIDLEDSGAAAAGLVDPEAGVRMELRVRRPETPTENPFYGDEQTFATTCSTRKGVYDELPVAVVGAARAVRMRCRGARHENGAPMAAMMYRAVGGTAAAPVHIIMFAFFEAATPETPDRAAADVMQYVRFVTQ
jgi:hypothetical protein